MAIDELQQIAHARADMMARDYFPLRLEMGRNFANNLRRQVMGYTSHHSLPLIILDMPWKIRPDMEGFSVIPANP